MALSDFFRSKDSLSTELAQHETDICCLDGLMPENVNTEDYESAVLRYTKSNMTREEIVDRLQETRKRVWR